MYIAIITIKANMQVMSTIKQKEISWNAESGLVTLYMLLVFSSGSFAFCQHRNFQRNIVSKNKMREKREGGALNGKER